MTQDERQIEELLNEIDKNVDQQNWSAVRELSEQILRIDPDNEHGIANLGAAERRLKARHDAASEETQRQPEELPPTLS